MFISVSLPALFTQLNPLLPLFNRGETFLSSACPIYPVKPFFLSFNWDETAFAVVSSGFLWGGFHRGNHPNHPFSKRIHPFRRNSFIPAEGAILFIFTPLNSEGQRSAFNRGQPRKQQAGSTTFQNYLLSFQNLLLSPSFLPIQRSMFDVRLLKM